MYDTSSLQAFLRQQIDGGFGVRAIGRETGVSSSTISRIVNGKVSPDLRTCNRILKPFGYRVEIVRCRNARANERHAISGDF